MAQVMNYFEWPQGAGAGTGSVEVNGETLTMNFAQTTFDWANMLNKYTNSATATQKNAVAVLMKACGYSVNMNYGTDASGAQSSALVGALINNFGYDGGIHYDHRDFYSYDEWVDKLYAEMAAGRPVLYGGSSDSGGHQFVFDGFRASDKAFHVNWGWGATATATSSWTLSILMVRASAATTARATTPVRMPCWASAVRRVGRPSSQPISCTTTAAAWLHR